VVAFSLAFENDYPYVLDLLALSGIPIWSAERQSRDPLIMAGGIAVTLNPEPLADFVDLFLIGEGEEAIPSLLESYLAVNAGHSMKEEILAQIQRSVTGAYVPSFYHVTYEKTGEIAAIMPRESGLPPRINRLWVKDLDHHPCEQVIITPHSTLGSMYLVEVNRGCGRGCRFCAAGFAYRPVRFRSPESIKQSIARGAEQVGRVGLMGTAVSDHPAIIDLLRYTIDLKGKVAISSLRLDRLTEELVTLLVAGGLKTVALAPETGSARLREVIRKGITDVHVKEAVQMLLLGGIEQFRLYAMIGLPTEEDEDIAALIELITKVAETRVEGKGGRRGPRTVTVSINPFVPKATTPFQWEPMARSRYLKNSWPRLEALAAVCLPWTLRRHHCERGISRPYFP